MGVLKMKEYHKIQTVYLRDPETKFKTLLDGFYSKEEFHFLENNKWAFTEKVDGTNIRIIYNNDEGKIYIKGKTDKAELHPALFKKLNELFLPKLDVFRGINKTITLYGEGYGEKVQSGGKYIKGHDFVLFDVLIGYWWLNRNDVVYMANKFEVSVVPVIGIGTLTEMVELARSGFKSTWGDFIAEGIVARPEVELYNRAGERVITKIKYKDFTKS